MIKHYRDGQNKYIGAYGSGIELPADAVESPAPSNIRDTWDGSKWVDYIRSEKELRRDKIISVLDRDDMDDLILDIAQAINKLDPLAIRQSLKDKVRDALL